MKDRNRKSGGPTQGQTLVELVIISTLVLMILVSIGPLIKSTLQQKQKSEFHGQEKFSIKWDGK